MSGSALDARGAELGRASAPKFGLAGEPELQEAGLSSSPGGSCSAWNKAEGSQEAG